MKPFRWDPIKNDWLKAKRGVSFEDVRWSVANGGFLEEIDHPNKARYGHQKMLIVQIRNYAYAVPFVESENEMFLKTIIPSRRATKRYLRGGN